MYRLTLSVFQKISFFRLTNSLIDWEFHKEAALILNHPKLTLKRLELNKLSDAGVVVSSQWVTLQKKILEVASV